MCNVVGDCCDDRSGLWHVEFASPHIGSENFHYQFWNNLFEVEIYLGPTPDGDRGRWRWSCWRGLWRPAVLPAESLMDVPVSRQEVLHSCMQNSSFVSGWMEVHTFLASKWVDFITSSFIYPNCHVLLDLVEIN